MPLASSEVTCKAAEFEWQAVFASLRTVSYMD